jgi:hypothetical protein
VERDTDKVGRLQKTPCRIGAVLIDFALWQGDRGHGEGNARIF